MNVKNKLCPRKSMTGYLEEMLVTKPTLVMRQVVARSSVRLKMPSNEP
jgi:hypothetical protein